MLKRIFDICFSLVMLILLMPLFFAIALLIKITSPGPVFYLQDRAGRGEHLFKLIKFRSMAFNSDQKGLLITQSNDPRVTPLGKILRKYKLDELPQFLNVLLGQMSVVGPRPEVLKYLEYYSKDQRNQIFTLKPGITDLASLHFKNEEQLLQGDASEKYYIKEILPVKISFYLDYSKKQNLWLDAKIIAKTVFEILR